MSFITAVLLLIFFGSLFIVGWILLRALPVLARLEVEDHPKVRETRTKHALLFGRWERLVRERSSTIGNRFAPLIAQLREWVSSASARVLHLERRYGLTRIRKRRPMMGKTVAEEVHLLLERARTELSEGRTSRAEETYVEILRLDPRNVEAYWGLVGVYRAARATRETLETLYFLTKLLPEDAEVWYELARESQVAENTADMFEAAGRAVAIESANPKYLDFLCEAAIVMGRRGEALDAFRKLEAANPENQKLKEFRSRIKAL